MGAGRIAGPAVLGLVVLGALAASVLSSHAPFAMAGRPLVAPFADPAFPLGTDQLGRDVLSGLLYGARTSLVVGFAAAVATLLVGATVGLAAGFGGRLLDAVLMRVTEAFQSVPPFLLALALGGVIGASTGTLVMAIAAASWPLPARIVRAEARRLGALDYVAAARLSGRNPVAIAIFVVLPGAVQPLVALLGVTVAEAVLVEGALSFLGLGDPNVMSWGSMVANGRALLRSAPHLVLLPGLSIAVTVVAVSLTGDALARALRVRA